MSNLLVMKEQIQRFYAGHSKIIDKAIRFVLALITFLAIGHSVGYVKLIASPFVSIVIAVVCAFLPLLATVALAAGVLIANFSAVSIGIGGITAAIFLVMFIFYFRFTPKRALVVLLTPVAFMLHIPYVIPIVFGLVGTPVFLIPIACGTIVYFMIDYVKVSAKTIAGAGSEGMIGQVTAFVQQIFANKEMWITIIAFIVCLFIVYNLRKHSMDHAWEIAIGVGAICNIVIMVAGDIALNIHTPYVALIAGSLVSVVIALVLELFVFTVDYSRTETLQYEDDEYYYYVKAVPKVSIAPPEKTVKRINERQETTVIDAKEIEEREKKILKKPSRKAANTSGEKRNKQPAKKQKNVSKTVADEMGNTDKVLLAKHLEEELNIQAMVEEELNK